MSAVGASKEIVENWFYKNPNAVLFSLTVCVEVLEQVWFQESHEAVQK